MIRVSLEELRRSVDIRRGSDTLQWVTQGGDFWPYFCQLIKTPEDAHGVASALAAAAGHSVEQIEPSLFRVIAFEPNAKKRKK